MAILTVNFSRYFLLFLGVDFLDYKLCKIVCGVLILCV